MIRVGWLVLLWPVATTVIYAVICWLENKYNKRYKNFGQQHGGKGNKIHKTLGDIIMRREF